MGNESSISGIREVISQFVKSCEGVELDVETEEFVVLKQGLDHKSLKIFYSEVSKVLERVDPCNQAFLQVNFINSEKLLLTDTLVGFKPLHKEGLEMDKIPKIVTTPDLLNIIEAIEDLMDSTIPDEVEVEVLRQLFFSVLEGAERVGFDLSREKTWIAHLNLCVPGQFKASA